MALKKLSNGLITCVSYLLGIYRKIVITSINQVNNQYPLNYIRTSNFQSYPRRNFPEDGGAEEESMPREFGVDTSIRRSSDSPTRAVWRVCIAGTRVAISNLLAVDITSFPTKTLTILTAGT